MRFHTEKARQGLLPLPQHGTATKETESLAIAYQDKDLADFDDADDSFDSESDEDTDM